MKTIFALLLRIALLLAPIAPVGMVALTPSTAEASSLDQTVEDISLLIIQGKVREAAVALSAFYWEGGNMETLLGLIERRLAQERATAGFLGIFEKALNTLPSKMLPAMYLPVTPLIVIPPDDALAPVAGRGGENDEA